MTSILFVDPDFTLKYFVKCHNFIKRLSFVRRACTHAIHFTAFEWCRSVVAMGSPIGLCWALRKPIALPYGHRRLGLIQINVAKIAVLGRKE